MITVKRNQPGLHAQLTALPWRQIPVACQTRERGHGRAERRTLKFTAVAAGLAWLPCATLVLAILRLAGATSIAAALRHHARRPDRSLRTIMNCETTCRGLG